MRTAPSFRQLIGSSVMGAFLVVTGCAVPVTPMPSLSAPPSPAAATPTPITAPSAEEVLRRAASKRVFFAHQSVGGNVLEAIAALYADAHLSAPEDVWVGGPHEVIPASKDGVLAETLVGENGDPDGKADAFARLLRGGIGAQVEVAVLKYCYADLSEDSDAEARFVHYRATMQAVEAEFPEVTFLYATDPVTTEEPGANVVRTRFNTLIRNEYAATGRLWDVAAIESTRPDGSRVTGSYHGQPYEALFEGYSADGGHPNASGSAALASALLRLIATTG
ncbi:MAG: hypothetical protein LWW77_11770 [Propionibacteriales bacterium]|nr:hypothetical protein [Propionibacteriales bacterium]